LVDLADSAVVAALAAALVDLAAAGWGAGEAGMAAEGREGLVDSAVLPAHMRECQTVQNLN